MRFSPLFHRHVSALIPCSRCLAHLLFFVPPPARLPVAQKTKPRSGRGLRSSDPSTGERRPEFGRLRETRLRQALAGRALIQSRRFGCRSAFIQDFPHDQLTGLIHLIPVHHRFSDLRIGGHLVHGPAQHRFHDGAQSPAPVPRLQASSAIRCKASSVNTSSTP